ncbi:ABC transporter permease [Umezawaea tangerina]|uniref:Putative spermidine/putrescine transport system permease protein n=1 Tax=Umezawaea tangerina TaxID=84725 RepID=A0A2T0SQK2_9PSEU|nr:ABC transporter permease [Umezawaea tangerina]PRY35692.1 putative spermidine/putrescine transport system permease protein [Umezawaea tangerina]
MTSQVKTRRRPVAVDPVPWWLKVFGGLVVAFFILPTLFVIPMSFSSATTFQFPPPGFSWRLYENFFTNPVWLDSLGNSFLVASLTALLATTVGTAAAVALSRLDGKAARFARTVLMVPIVAPSIVVAVAVYISFLGWRLTGTVGGYVLAHTAIAVPYVLVSVTGALGGFDQRLLKASASLGASPLRSFVRVTMPLISRGILTGAIFAFIVSFDEVVIALFLRSPLFQTMPVQMYNSVTVEIDPTISAASSLMVLAVTIIFILPQLLRGRAGRRQERRP